MKKFLFFVVLFVLAGAISFFSYSCFIKKEVKVVSRNYAAELSHEMGSRKSTYKKDKYAELDPPKYSVKSYVAKNQISSSSSGKYIPTYFSKDFDSDESDDRDIDLTPSELKEQQALDSISELKNLEKEKLATDSLVKESFLIGLEARNKITREKNYEFISLVIIIGIVVSIVLDLFFDFLFLLADRKKELKLKKSSA